MRYWIYPRNPILRKYVDHISLDRDVPGDKKFIPILPDGMTELVINLGDPHQRRIGNSAGIIDVKGSHFIGIKSRFHLKKQNGFTKTINIRFKPGAVSLFLCENVPDLKDGLIDAGELFSNEIYELEKKANDLTEERDLISRIETFLMGRLSLNKKALQTMEIVKLMYGNPVCTRIEEIKKVTGLSYKQLERRFRSYVGLHPKLLMKIVKFNYATKIISEVPGAPFTEVAHRSGYFDQSHFIKDFKYFSGQLPKKYNPNNSFLISRNQKVINKQFNIPLVQNV